jgi:hypothetical protein
MLTDEQFQIAHPKLKVLQIIVAAMSAGVLMFALVTNLIHPWAQSTMDISMLPLLGAAASFFSIILSFVLPALAANSTPKISDDDSPAQQQKLVSNAAGVFLTGRIIRLALLEGGCFLNLVVYLLEESRLSLIAVAIGLFLLILSFPTASAMRSWLDARVVD